MRTKGLSIRLRLTLWFAAGLSLILVVLTAGSYFLVRTGLERALTAQLNRDLMTVAAVLGALPTGSGPTIYVPGDVLFLVTDGKRAVYQSDGWCRAGLLKAIPSDRPCITGAWRSQEGKTFSVKSCPLRSAGGTLLAYVAEDRSFADDILGRLRQLLLLGIPGAVILSLGGGYALAGRALSPIARMAAKAREITAESLSERLPAGNPHDELGQMASVFNDTLARLERSFARLRAFAANVSHELRTPLAAIQSVGEAAMERPCVGTDCRDAIGSMLEEVGRMTRLTECLLNLARAERGGSQLPREKVDLAAIAEASIDLVRILAEEKGQRLSLTVGKRPITEGDPATVSQALIDLLDNAIRYTPGGGRIEVSVDCAPDGSPVLIVEDNGPGIRREDRERIFDRFYRAETAEHATAGGTGLGLAIARSAVEANGGRLEYEDATGGGSRFRMTFAQP